MAEHGSERGSAIGAAPGPDHWFEALADHLGGAYLRYSFTKGTANEVAFLIDQLGLVPGQRVLDVGCGPGRHALALGAAGIEVVGIDISQRFVDLGNAAAPAHVRFERRDARQLPFDGAFDGEFDAVISLCQGAFGLSGGPAAEHGAPGSGGATTTVVDPDGVVLDGMARAVKPGGLVAVSAFSAYFQVRYLEEADAFDAVTGVNHERTTLRDEQGAEADHDLWTTCFTPRELRLLAARAGLVVEALWSVTPGAYRADPPDLDHPELLVVARRPSDG